MKKIIKIIILIFLILINFSLTNAGLKAEFLTTKNKIEEINYKTPKIQFGEISVKYEIGYKNEIGENSFFYPISLNFSKKIENGVLEIYKEKFKYFHQEKGEGEKLYKKIKIKNTDNLETYFYKNDTYGYEKYYFYLSIAGERKKLNVNNNRIYENKLYISKQKINNFFSIKEVPELFILNQFNIVYLEKNISKQEIKNLINYVYSGGNLILNNSSKESFNDFLLKIEKNKNYEIVDNYCENYIDCSDKKHINFYKYGFGKIYLKNPKIGIDYNRNYTNFLGDYEIKKILIDEKIKSKFVPFYIILYFTIIYFLSFIIINFILSKKYKFFIFYSIPAGALFFLIIISSISFYYKGFKDIENKIQINNHIDNKILSQVFIANFSSNGGDYILKIDKENYINNDFNHNYYYRENFAKKEIDFEKGKIIRKLLGVNSSSILYFYYYNISNEDIKEKKSNIIKEFKTQREILDFFKIKKENQYGKYSYKIDKNIKKIVLLKKETELMKKISFGGEKNQNYVIDIYYK